MLGIRSFAAIFTTVALLSGCVSLGVGGNQAGVRVVGKQTYCGTPSQASAFHYFSNENAFENWASYRDIGNWHVDVPERGVLVVEMGQRPTGGYKLQIVDQKTRISNGVLDIAMNWHAPRLDAAVSQAMTTQCLAVALPDGDYGTVRLTDQLGDERGRFDVDN